MRSACTSSPLPSSAPSPSSPTPISVPSTWLYMCPPHGYICALNMALYVPSTWLYMCPEHDYTCALNMAHVRQSRPDSGRGFQVVPHLLSRFPRRAPQVRTLSPCIRQSRTEIRKSRPDGTYKTVKAVFWPWLSGQSPRSACTSSPPSSSAPSPSSPTPLYIP